MKNFYMKKSNYSGFTLIELLIVVLIIAILAAIAVPNFLEFQTRAKVSRVLSDQRSLATAIEAYTVDNGRAPIDAVWGRDQNTPSLWDPRDEWVLQITTPIAYISSKFIDPFVGKASLSSGSVLLGEEGYIFRNFDEPRGTAAQRQTIISNGYRWILKSLGPNFQAEEPFVIEMLETQDPNPIYDPTNGTLSSGDIFRTNKGILANPQL